jgi:hypothetical protein
MVTTAKDYGLLFRALSDIARAINFDILVLVLYKIVPKLLHCETGQGLRRG